MLTIQICARAETQVHCTAWTTTFLSALFLLDTSSKVTWEDSTIKTVRLTLTCGELKRCYRSHLVVMASYVG
jgi:hypothetical protein